MSYANNVRAYLQAVEAAHTHTGKLITFSELLNLVFGVSSYEVVPNVEQYIKSGGLLVLKGRLDLRLGQTILEFKIDLAKELETAKEEIERYTSILRKNNQKVAECIITDGKTFKVFTVRDGAKEVRSINFAEVTPEQAIMFLDTFLFSGRKVPTADDLNMRFGPGSPIYEEIVGELATLFKTIKDPVKFELWSKNMQLVYGSTPPEEAFVSQTYLMVLVRLLLAEHLTKGSSLPVRDALGGRLFDSQGINIIEDDFFSWVLNPLFWPQVKPLLETLIDAFDSYDLESVDEDIFKEIYQEIVKRGDRHRIGEYYTPEWLAELTLNEAVAKLDPKHERKIFSILDPACGSGTFLTNAVALLKRGECTLEDILGNVYGIDLNPLAVAIARANYLLALGKLIEMKKGPIFIPVFMADSIRFPTLRRELLYNTDVLAIDVEKGIQMNLPLNIALNDSKLKQVLDVFAEILIEYKAKRLDRNQAVRACENKLDAPKPVKDILERTLTTIMDLIDVHKDSVWVFMMRNVYAPLRMKAKRFDLVIGNPPWISYKFVENASYKKFIKDTYFEYGLLRKKQANLVANIDTSTLFYTKAADVYLSNNGVLAFVMPRSVLTAAKQHEAFKKQQKPPMSILKILDVENVDPLFNVDACAFIAKKGGITKYPVKTLVLSGILPEKNLHLNKATKYLTKKEGNYSPLTKPDKASYYHSKVFEGTCIIPRTLWFVKFLSGTFGLNPNSPSVESLVLPGAKKPWKNVTLRGEIEKEFVFLTVTGKSLLPFKPEFLPVVLPIKKGKREFSILSSNNLRRDGKLKMANWLDEAAIAWTDYATSTSLKNFPEPMDYVNYHSKLLLQKQNIRFFVIYTGSGTHIAAAVVDTKKLPDIKIGNAKISPGGFIADYKTYWFSTNNEEEAYYLAALLNSEPMDQIIKPHQSRGKFGPRDIGRLPFEFNIPRFDRNNKIHKQIAVLGMKAAEEATKITKTSRLKMKGVIPSMNEIDKLVLELVKT